MPIHVHLTNFQPTSQRAVPHNCAALHDSVPVVVDSRGTTTRNESRGNRGSVHTVRTVHLAVFAPRCCLLAFVELVVTKAVPNELQGEVAGGRPSAVASVRPLRSTPEGTEELTQR